MDGQGALAELRESAGGWHRVQLAVLGFIGLCGVLKGDGGASDAGWLAVLPGLLVLLALVLACLATALVGRVAWPLESAQPDSGSVGADSVDRARRLLRAGITTTFVAVAVLAVATTSSWWPSGAASLGEVEVTTRGGVLCGQLLEEAPQGALALDVGDRRLQLSLNDVVALRPVARCP